VTAVSFYFQVHQPFRLRRYTFFDIGASEHYFDDPENERIVKRVAQKSYIPMNTLVRQLVEETKGDFRCSYSVSGAAIRQMQLWAPEALDSFKALADTGAVEFLCETSHHSLASLADLDEFRAQVEEQRALVHEVFGHDPVVFRNTELVIDARIARAVEELGFRALLGEGADHLLGWRSPHHVYRPEGCEKLKLLLRSYAFSDDIAFRFSNRGWHEWPLTAEKFGSWVGGVDEDDAFVGLYMDYETFGEHQWEDTGIFDFMRALPQVLLSNPRLSFATPGEVALRHDPVSRLSIPRPVSWADAERDMTAWLGNPMQRSAQEALYAALPAARELARRGEPAWLETWRRLSTSDHLYYMCTKWFSDGDVHKYFSPYASPHDAFITFMNVLDDFARRSTAALEASRPLQAPRRLDASAAPTPEPSQNP
jgi:alpha-amylase